MFRKIEIWVLFLFILLSVPISISFGVLVRQELVGSKKLGKLSQSALFLAELPKNIKRITENLNLISNDRFPMLNGFKGEPNSKESYLLLSRYDGDLKEGIVELIDLRNFEVLHSWNPDIDSFNKLVSDSKEFKYLKRDRSNYRSKLVHPKLTSDGGLLFGWEQPLTKIDECGNLLFQVSHDEFHHSIETDIDGNIWVPSHIYPQTLEKEKIGRKIRQEGGFRDDGIVKLSPKGEILFEKSVAEIFLENGLNYLLFAHGNDYEFDPIHLNDIQPVDYDSEYWKKGDVFLSLRSQSMVVLYRPSTNEIIWKGTGPFLHQHDVDILDNSRISVFNNRSINIIGNGDVNIVDGYNEVNIFDFKTKEYSSYLKNSLSKNKVMSKAEGRSQILPNGDMYIEESDFARTIYFNSDGSIRWQHLNRAKNGKVYGVGWSRIIYTKNDILDVNNFLKSRNKCNV